MTTLRVRRVRRKVNENIIRLVYWQETNRSWKSVFILLTNLPLQTFHLFLNPTIFMQQQMKQRSTGTQVAESCKSCWDLV